MLTAQKTKSTIDAIFSTSFSASMIIMFLNFSGMGFFMHHLVPRASSYVLPAERELAASAQTSNQG